MTKPIETRTLDEITPACMVRKMSLEHSKNTDRGRDDSLSQSSELAGASLPNGIEIVQRESLRRMHTYRNQASEILKELGVIAGEIFARIGPELEFFSIAGEESSNRRMRQLIKATDDDTLSRDDSFMPKKAQAKNLTKVFDTGLTYAKHVIVDQEPAYRLGVAREISFSRDGKTKSAENIAIFQHEIVSPPRRLPGFPLWANTIGQRIIDEAANYDLKRTEIVTTLHDMSSSSLHMHLSLEGFANGKMINLMSRDSFPDEKKTRKNNPGAPSQLALHIGSALNEFLRDYIYLFAPTEDAYVRFSDKQFVGTSFIGFRARKERFNMGSAMFRGAGRSTFREEDTEGVPDTGPLRIELRVADVGAIGHPNKRAYPEQAIAPYYIAEAIAYVIKQGVESYRQSIQDREVHGRSNPPLTEDGLYQKTYPLPRSPGEAAERMRQALRNGETFLTQERLDEITARGFRQQFINELDKKPNLERGQTPDRTALLKLMLRD